MAKRYTCEKCGRSIMEFEQAIDTKRCGDCRR